MTDHPAEAVEAPQEPVLAAQEAEEEEGYVSPLILAARRGEQVDFGTDIVLVDQPSDTPDDTQE